MSSTGLPVRPARTRLVAWDTRPSRATSSTASEFAAGTVRGLHLRARFMVSPPARASVSSSTSEQLALRRRNASVASALTCAF
ncbi:hypothetical protein SpCBS45565_g02869 [Spizellomyces sp. 'palustris']|nr:hypothetical protein SpCBS45565_g02869 [Spizellomyces sp. 'palustris']